MDRNVDEISTAYEWVEVVPYVGTWIEMTVWGLPRQPIIVVPYVGTWIEM